MQFKSETHSISFVSRYQKYSNWQFQYLVWPPLAFITASILLGMLSIKF